jgi:hypothetical protein
VSILILLIVIGAIAAFVMLRSGENLRFETSCDPHRVIMAAIGIVGAKRRWQTMVESNHGASFQYHRGPRVLVAIVLLFCFVIPGVVYLVLAGKRESLVLTVDSTTAGMTIVQATSNGFRGKAAGRALQRLVSVPAGALGAGPPALTTGRH